MGKFLGTFDKQIKQEEAVFDITLYKRQMVNVLKVYDDFCRKHELRYSIAYGALIGAIRHKGYIPWDDDIDVVMPRPDYDKFIELTMDKFVSGYEVKSAYNDKDYTLSFAKVIDSNTTLIETQKTKRMILGSYVDIFPIDGMPFENKLVDQIDLKKRCLLERGQLLQLIPFKETKNLKLILKWVLFTLIGKKSQAEIIKADGIARNFSFDQSSSAMYYGSSNKYRAAFSPCLFDNLIEIPFEDIKIKCFAKYDAVLTNWYGDYMKLPPKEYQISQHYHYFVDLHRRWTINELKGKGII